MTCPGYNPYYQRLEAVRNIKRSSGYSGNLSSNSSHGYARFFIDYKDASGFQDMGHTNGKVADIPDTGATLQHPMSYLAFSFINDKKHCKFLECLYAVIRTLRAIFYINRN